MNKQHYPPGTEEILKDGEDDAIIRVGKKQSGSWTVMEYAMSAWASGPPKHYHSGFEQIFIIQTGHPKFYLNGDVIDCEPRSIVHVKKGDVHTVSNPSDENVLFYTIMVPGGFEEFFRKLDKFHREGIEISKEELKAISAEHDEYLVE